MDLEAAVVAPKIELTAEDSAAVAAAHDEILDAVAAGKAEQARATMAGHVMDVQHRLRRLERLRRSDRDGHS